MNRASAVLLMFVLGLILSPVPAALAQQPGHGPDRTDQIVLPPENSRRKQVSRAMAAEWSDLLGLGQLNRTEAARIDGVVWNQARHAAFDHAGVRERLTAEAARFRRAGRSVELEPGSLAALQSAAAEQSLPAIIELSLPPAGEPLAALTGRVKRVDHVYHLINAVAVELTPAQLVGVAQLPFVVRIWPDAPAQMHMEDSVPQIGAAHLHDLGLTGQGVKVAVVDMGLQDDHVQYEGRVVAERYDKDDGDHATHVAGIIASGWTMMGVAPKALLMDAVFDKDDDLTGHARWSDVIGAIEWAADQGADVINASVGAPIWEYPRDGSSVVDTAVDNVVTQHGIPVIVSAGNYAQKQDSGQAEGHTTPGSLNRYWHAFRLDSDNQGVRLTLWWDYGNNDLDLELMAPDGTVVQSQSPQPGEDTPYHAAIYYEQVEFSQANVAQQVQSYGTGATWWARVIAPYGSTPDGPQPYHISLDIGDGRFTSPDPVGTVAVPATARQALAVGSVKDGSTDTLPPAIPINERSAFSAQGPTGNDPQLGYRIKPEIMAPGEDIESTTVNGLGNKEGTSQAAPHVAGAMALLLEAAGQRSDGEWQLTQAELRGAIIDTAQDLDGDGKIDNVTGAGLVRPDRAVFTGTITHEANRYYKITPQYQTNTYAGVTGQVIGYDWQSVACRWNSSAHDLDLYLYRLDTGSQVAAANTTAPTYDKIDGAGTVSDDYDYLLRVYGWQVSGTAVFTGVSTNLIEPVEPPALAVEADSTNPAQVDKNQSFTLRFDVTNDGDLTARSAVASLSLPAGVELVSGDNPQPLGAISPGGQATAVWQVRGLTAGDKSFTVEADSTGWGASWSDSGSDSVYIRPIIGPLVYASHTVDDDTGGQSSGNDDGTVQCGETVELFVALQNQGSDTATALNADLSAADSYVSWPANTASTYPDLEGSQTGDNLDDFELQIASNTPDGHVISFELAVTGDDGAWSDSFDLTVACNHAPNTPGSPDPAHTATGVAVTTGLSWSGGDPDSGDSVTYDLYFEADDSSPDSLVCYDISTAACDPGGDLLPNTDYYWQVIATDNHGLTATGSVWRFTTANTAPNTPGNPGPADDATGVSISTGLSWSGGDPDSGDSVTYDIYFEANDTSPDSLACDDIAAISCDPGGLAYSTDYYWQVVAEDSHGATAAGPVWHFTTGSSPNQPPNTPGSPSPTDSATGVAVTATLSWSGGDPDGGDSVTYDVYVEAGDTSPDSLACNDISTAACNPSGDFAYGADYYWQVVAEDNHGATAAGPVWHFTTENDAPNTPSGPSPADDATGAALSPTLSWSGGDPNPGDTVAYDVYFEANDSSPDSLACHDISATTCAPGGLAYSTDYYWQVVAEDNHGATAAGPVWHFTTLAADVGPLAYAGHTIDDDTGGQSSGNDDGTAHCGETIELYVTLQNQGSDTAAGLTATISTADSYVSWLYNTGSDYPDLSGGGTGLNSNDFDFQLDSDTPDGHEIGFDLTIQADSGGPWSDSFTVTVACNSSPNQPASPTPADEATQQDRNVDLSWSGGDPDSGDTVTYDLYLEANDSFPTVLVCDDVTVAACDPGPLAYSTHYYWRVVARDNHGATRAGPIWEFSTAMQSVTGPLVYDSHANDDDNLGASFGNDDGLIHCGESIESYVTLRNQDTNTALYVTGSLTATDPYLAWPGPAPQDYFHIGGGQSETNEEPFAFQVDSNAPDGHILTFTVEISAINGGPWSDTFTDAVKCDNPSGVVINEIHHDCEGYCSDPPAWIELYNAGSAAVDMSGWQFWAYDHDNIREVEYTFGSFSLAAGDYVILHEGSGSNSADHRYLWDYISWDYFRSRGAAALVDDSGNGVDFVRWQGSGVEPPTGTAWHGEILSGPPEGQTLARDQFSADTDHAADWTIQSPTENAVNLGTNSCYTLTLTHYGGGSDPRPTPTNTPGCGTYAYIPGSAITFTAEPVDSQWWIANWIGTAHDTTTAATNTLTMPAAHHTTGINYKTGSILINEIDQTGSYDQIELYNAGSQPVDLSEWRLKTYSLHYDGGSCYVSPFDPRKCYTYNFPNGFVLQPGAYVVIHEGGLSSYNTATDLYMATGGDDYVYWYAGDGGAVELRTGSAITSGVDFVRWGDTMSAPPDPPEPTGWHSPDPAAPPRDQTLGRNQVSLDTNYGHNWLIQNPSLREQNLCHSLTLTHTGEGGPDPAPSNIHSTGCPGGQYVMSDTIQVVAGPTAGWYVARWSGTNNDHITDTINYVTMPDETHQVTVSYAETDIPGPIRINELAPDGSGNWIELYNAGSQAVDMTGWRFVAYDYRAEIDADYTFPAFTLPPGAYVILHEESGTDTAAELYMGQSIWYFANSEGAAALYTAGGSGVDFVRWRGSAVEPPPGDAWSGEIPWWSASDDTIGRDRFSADTDAGSDWTVQTPTPGLRNICGAACQIIDIGPGRGGTLFSPDGQVSVAYPADAIAYTIIITYTEIASPTRPISGLVFAGRAFTLEATDSNGQPVTTLLQPYTITLQYPESAWQTAGIGDETSLNLYYWSGTQWQALLPCPACSLETANNRLVVVLSHLSEYMLAGLPEEKPDPWRNLYLPLICK